MGELRAAVATFWVVILLTNIGIGWGILQLHVPPPAVPQTTAAPEGTADAITAGVVAVTGGNYVRSVVGSGFFVSPSGLVVTSAHVVDDPRSVYTVVTGAGERFVVEQVIRSQTSDIAVLKTSARDIPWLPLESVHELTTGELVTAVGAGAGWLTSSGPVIGVGRSVITDIRTVEIDVIQAEVAVRPGSSGGPLLNKEGEVVGVVFAFSPENPAVGFAIPAERLNPLMEEIADGGIALR